MSEKHLADIFSINGGAKIVSMNVSEAKPQLSGAGKSDLENVYKQPLTPMKDYAQSVEKLSGMGKDAAEKIFSKELVGMQNYGENVPPLFNALMQAIDRGYNEVHDVNKPNDALQLSDEAKNKINKMAKEVPMTIYNRKSARTAS